MNMRGIFPGLMLFFFVINGCKAFNLSDSLSHIQNGRMIFQTHCSPCHGVHREILGPMLGSVTKKRSKEWLMRFIMNSQNVIASGDKYAISLAERYRHAVMPRFDKFSTSALEDVLAYIENESLQPTEKIIVNPNDYDRYMKNDILRGKLLFENQCASCHSITKEGYGPSLGSVSKRHPEAWLLSFVKNSQQVIQSGDPYATELYKRFGDKVMVSMEFLKDDEIRDIFQYIEFKSSAPAFMGGSNGLKLPSTQHVGVERSAQPDHSTDGEVFFKTIFAVVALTGLALIGLIVTRFYRFLVKERHD